MEMKISTHKDAIGIFIYAMVHDYILDAVASRIQKRPDKVKFDDLASAVYRTAKGPLSLFQQTLIDVSAN